MNNYKCKFIKCGSLLIVLFKDYKIHSLLTNFYFVKRWIHDNQFARQKNKEIQVFRKYDENV